MGSLNLRLEFGFSSYVPKGLLVGLAGGAAEVAWILVYSGLGGGSAVDVATGVSATVLPMSVGTAVAVPLGLAIHFALAIVLGLALVESLRQFLPRLAGSFTEMGIVITALAAVWAVNFLVILPVVNPSFVHIVPISVSLTSKLLFGVAAALVLRAPHRAK